MFRSLHIAATGMSAQETHLETVSNNIANANTVGYKKQRADFQDLLYQTIRAAGAKTGPDSVSPTGLQIGSGVKVVGTARVFQQGAIQNTNNPLDVAIEGSGFFVVQQGDGTQAFTRAGGLRTDPDGRIVTPEGPPPRPPDHHPAGCDQHHHRVQRHDQRDPLGTARPGGGGPAADRVVRQPERATLDRPQPPPPVGRQRRAADRRARPGRPRDAAPGLPRARQCRRRRGR